MCLYNFHVRDKKNNRNYLLWHQHSDKSLWDLCLCWDFFVVLIIRIVGSAHTRKNSLLFDFKTIHSRLRNSFNFHFLWMWSSVTYCDGVSDNAEKKSEIVFFCRWHFNKSYLNLCFRRLPFSCISHTRHWFILTDPRALRHKSRRKNLNI